MGDFDDWDEFIEEMQKRIYEKDRQDFSEHALYLANHPYKYGKFDPALPGVLSGWYRSSCGDSMTIYLKIGDGRIVDIRYEVDGCVASSIAGSQLCLMADGSSLEDAWKIRAKDVLDKLGKFPEENHHCASLAVEALRNALKSYNEKNHEKA